MQNRQQSAQGNVPEHNDYAAEGTATGQMQEEVQQHVYLLGLGFTQEEARKLQHQRAHIYENDEMQQRLADDSRIHFARWLYEQGEINEK